MSYSPRYPTPLEARLSAACDTLLAEVTPQPAPAEAVPEQASPSAEPLNPLAEILAAIQETNRLLGILATNAAPAKTPAGYATLKPKG